MLASRSWKKNKIYCTAGMSFLTIFPNGDVYRCTNDYNLQRNPLFNVLDDNWNILVDIEECEHDCCIGNTDVYTVQKFMLDENERIISFANNINASTETFPEFLALHEKFMGKHRLVKLIWLPTHACNLNCFYCDFGDAKKRMHIHSSKPELSTQQWIEVFKRFKEYFDWGILGISGGEPLMSKAVFPVMNLMKDDFQIRLVTNLSINILDLARLRIEENDKVFASCIGVLKVGLHSITTSIHPTARNFSLEKFKGAVLLLKNSFPNTPIRITLVGHPVQLFLAEEYSQWCKDNGFAFLVHPWNGSDHEGHTANLTQRELIYQNNFLNFNGLKIDDEKDQYGVLVDHILQEKPMMIGQDGLKKYENRRLTFVKYDKEFDNIYNEIYINYSDAIYTINSSVKNTSSFIWNEKIMKVGARLYDLQKELIKEFRADPFLEEVKQNEEKQFFMTLDFTGISRGNYLLSLDVVCEGHYWLEDKNSKALSIKIVLE